MLQLKKNNLFQEDCMKKALVLIIALLFALVFVGCNAAPNIPGVKPYVTNGVTNPTNPANTTNGFTGYRDGAPVTSYGNGYNGYDYNTPGTTNNQNLNKNLNTKNYGGVRSSVNVTDKSLIPNAG